MRWLWTVQLFYILSVFAATYSITITSYSDPKDEAAMFRKDSVNRTLTPNSPNSTERHRRLIPYFTYYQVPNNPNVQYVKRPQQILTHYKLVPVPFSTKHVRPAQQQHYRPKLVNYTPFSESNKLPGGFTPMVNKIPYHDPGNGVQQQQRQPAIKYVVYDNNNKVPVKEKVTQYSDAFPPQFHTHKYNQQVLEQPTQYENYFKSNYRDVVKVPETVIHTYLPENIDVEDVPRVKPVAVPIKQQPYYVSVEDNNSLQEILKSLQNSNALPQTFTVDNIDNSIRTLVNILNVLKQKQSVAQQNQLVEMLRPTKIEPVAYAPPSDTSTTTTQVFPGPALEGSTPGKPGIDYPALEKIPQTSFDCKTQRYKGFFGDPETHCQVWHYCDLNGGQASFLCPNGTVFSQVALTCDWWFNVKCSNTAQQYVLNERLYKYILPFTPKFPEDYSGPLVDKYLAIKFQEMEEKMRREKKGKGNATTENPDDNDNELESDDDTAYEETLTSQ